MQKSDSFVTGAKDEKGNLFSRHRLQFAPFPCLPDDEAHGAFFAHHAVFYS
jgi:hypothetical protein